MENLQTFTQFLESDQFTKIINKCEWLGKETILYAKEISDNLFLLFILENDKKIRAVIARFTCITNIGVRNPEQILFHLSLQKKEDLHYFEKYLHFSKN